MASQHQRSASAAGTTREKSYFEQQREELIGEIAMSFEHVLANINKLNRSLEAVIAVGNEFSSVEALWSTFENVMAKDPEEAAAANSKDGEEEGHNDDYEEKETQQEGQTEMEDDQSRDEGGEES
ncbi:DASH complex subunit Dad1-domain-containing protein [Podospora didyma]|uniref:DASH complex subunit DAD1 n=1 Tax=Podospora didyma TaxID=330526 RepID=A0AAE0U1N2_9PEZI|nr:DASH complex subunit Dad1-domain-containing protein [Podospora didyma]